MSKLINFDIIDPAINLSDNLPLLIVINSNTNADYKVIPNRKLLDFDGIIRIWPYFIRHLATFCRTYSLASITQYQLLSRQMAYLNRLVKITTVRTVRLTSTTLLIQCMMYCLMC